MLIDVDDVQPGVGKEARNRGDQPRPVRAGKQQAGGVGVWSDQGIMPIPRGIRALKPKRQRRRFYREGMSVMMATLIPSP
ncbi:MAG TPA: hypothetical protein VGI17_07365 [Solirubrobacterales bacterium]